MTILLVGVKTDGSVIATFCDSYGNVGCMVNEWRKAGIDDIRYAVLDDSATRAQFTALPNPTAVEG